MNIYVDARWTRTDFHDGISRYTSGIIQGFKENNIPITILIKDRKQLKMLPADIPHLLVNDPLSIKEFFLPLKLNDLGVDAVFTPFQIIGTWRRRYKLIVTLHDTIYYQHPQPPANTGPFQKVIWRLFHMAAWPQRLLLNSADCVATVSEYSKKNIQDLHLTDREICVIYNAPVLKKSDVKKDSKRTKNIVYMGSFMPYKNVELLIKGMDLLPKDFILNLLSKIPINRRQELERIIPKDAWVVFHNGVSDEKYINMLNEAYCLASASKEEGFGLPIIEAQILGTPVVCSDMTIFHEVAGDGALYFDYNDPKEYAKQIEKLSDEKFRKELVKKGIANADKFTWKNSAAKLYSILEKYVNTSK
ncbi:MAG: glycosyltransferase family 4 protein [Thiobacillus sp.]